jgi:hypothetical protein
VTGTATTATLTSTTALGATVTTSVYVPAQGRATVWANLEEQAGLAAAARAAYLARAPPGTPSGLTPPGGPG